MAAFGVERGSDAEAAIYAEAHLAASCAVLGALEWLRGTVAETQVL